MVVEYYMDIPKDIAEDLNVQGRQFPARSRKVVVANRQAFFGSILAKRIKIKKRKVNR